MWDRPQLFAHACFWFGFAAFMGSQPAWWWLLPLATLAFWNYAVLHNHMHASITPRGWAQALVARTLGFACGFPYRPYAVHHGNHHRYDNQAGAGADGFLSRVELRTVRAMDPKGKTVVVTGATSGLGQALAVELAKAGAKVFIVGRDAARANETLSRAGTGAEVVVGDVSTRAGVKAVAAAILARTKTIDVLVNNAGGSFKTEGKTADGLETTFAVNTFGAWLLEKELHGALAAAKGRVVNVATGLLDSFPVDPDDLARPKKFSSLKQYGRSKQASVMMTVEQAHRFAPEGVVAVALHPGVIMGTRFGGGQPKVVQAIMGPILRGVGFACTLEEATRRFRVACFEDVPSGSYVVKGKAAPLPKQVNDPAVRARVVALLEKLAA